MATRFSVEWVLAAEGRLHGTRAPPRATDVVFGALYVGASNAGQR
jgi:hypothetical protein